jgi:hypothetical protein
MKEQKPKKPKIEKLLCIGPLTGYREWQIKYFNKLKDFRIYGIGNGDIAWEKGINTAKCLKEDGTMIPDYKPLKHHKSPHFDCDCGFWAYKYKFDWIKHITITEKDSHLGMFTITINGLVNNLNSFQPTIDNIYIPGIVSLTGLVVEHELGYKSEKAEITKLIWCNDNEEIEFEVEEEAREKQSFGQIAQYGGLTRYSWLGQWNETTEPTPKKTKTFKSVDIIKALTDYYQVPMVNWKDYFRKEL